MAELVQLIRRHEETAVDNEGKKLDMPTHEGRGRDYRRGTQIREQYPSHRIYGVASERERTYIGLVAMLLGAGVTNVDDYAERSSDLNEGNIPAELRNNPARRFVGLFEECRDTTMDSGNNLARYVVDQIVGYTERIAPVNNLIIAKTHLPPMLAAYLQLIGKPFTLETAREHDLETKMKPGEGFDVKVERVGRVYGVTITLDNTTQQYDLLELQERVRR
ncbi:hypothetical protein HYY69_06510 [Candidatus Woesearchaeota archaeon]|nr:hypothetical protein [Candidatus Woesearchaeota archaeon]